MKIEFQRLHGMGEALYDAARDAFGPVTVRAYAPVGGHEDLLPYLVRRLLENGANSSFVHALLDERVPAACRRRRPHRDRSRPHPDRHAKIPVPKDMYMDRQNSLGRDYSQLADRERHALALQKVDSEKLTSGPIIGGKLKAGTNAQDVTNPFDTVTQVLGHVSEASAEDIDAAVRRRRPGPDRLGPQGRCGPGACAARHGRCAGSRHGPSGRPAVAGGRQDPERRRRRGARGRRLLPLLRHAGRA